MRRWACRLIIKLIAKQHGGDVDTSRDSEYADWGDLRQTIDEFLAAAVPSADG